MQYETHSRELALRERQFSRVRDHQIVRRVLRFLAGVEQELPVRIMSEERAGYRTDFIFDPHTQNVWQKTAHALQLALPFPCRDGTRLAYEAGWHIPQPTA